MRLASLFALLLAAALLAGCAPSLSPLYRDFDVAAASEASLAVRLADALREAGWTPDGAALAEAPGVLTTEERTLRHWGLYSIRARLEATPLGTGHVRVYVHAYRVYFTGRRSKIPFMSRSLQGLVARDLRSAFEAHGLPSIGTPRPTSGL